MALWGEPERVVGVGAPFFAGKVGQRYRDHRKVWIASDFRAFFYPGLRKCIGLGSRKWPTERKIRNCLCGRAKQKKSDNRLHTNKEAHECNLTGTSIAKRPRLRKCKVGCVQGLSKNEKQSESLNHHRLALHKKHKFSAQKLICFFVC